MPRSDALAARGIVTAFDIERKKVEAILGFAQDLTEQLLHWRRMKEGKFSLMAPTAIPPEQQQALVAKYEQCRTRVETEVLAGEGELKSIAANAERRRQELYENVSSAISQLAQADADLKAVPPGI